MAIIDIRYTSLQDNLQGDPDVLGATEIYDIQFDKQDHPGDRKFMAFYGTGWNGPTKMPPMRSSHRFAPFIFVIHKRVEVIGPFDYRVTVMYESVGDPLELLPIITYGGVGENTPIDQTFIDSRLAIPSVPIVNSSQELFDPPITTTISDGVVTIVRNEAVYDAALMDTFRDSINDDTWQVFALETVKLVSISAIRKEAQLGFFYYEVTYVLHIRRDGWKHKTLDQGFRTIKLDSGGSPVLDSEGAPIYIEIVDDKGKALTQPTLLNGSGQKLPDGEDAVKLEFLKNRRQDFDVLGLPTV